MTEVAHECNGNDFDTLSLKLAIVSKTMLDAVDKAKELYNNLTKSK